ncbi:hypothetical protein LTR53_019280, partial [Teratosphaeriaceae sp. CCFEE 6253]
TELFGSESTGLSLATSDLDIRLYDPTYTRDPDSSSPYDETYTHIGRPMRRLAQHLRRHKDYICVIFRWSKFPIINAQHRATGLDIQIVSSPSTAGQQAVTTRYLAELPHLRALFFVVRSMLGTRGLIDVFNGGLGS